LTQAVIWKEEGLTPQEICDMMELERWPLDLPLPFSLHAQPGRFSRLINELAQYQHRIRTITYQWARIRMTEAPAVSQKINGFQHRCFPSAVPADKDIYPGLQLQFRRSNDTQIPYMKTFYTHDKKGTYLRPLWKMEFEQGRGFIYAWASQRIERRLASLK